MASTKEMQARAKARKQAERDANKQTAAQTTQSNVHGKQRLEHVPTPSATTNYGKLVKEADGCDGSKVRVFRANQLGLDNYKLATGSLPYEIEHIEEAGLMLNDNAMGQMFGSEPEFDTLTTNSWRDHLLVITRDGKDYAYGFRVDSDNKPKTVACPAYRDTVTMSALEFGLARMCLVGSHLASYAYQRGEGPYDYVRLSAMSGIRGGEASLMYLDGKLALDAFGMMAAWRWLD
jgi:hypothetical protein